MSAADLPSLHPVVAAPSAYFLLNPSNMMNFPLKDRQVRFPVFTLVVSTSGAEPSVPEGHVIRTAEAIGIANTTALRYDSLNKAIAATNSLTHYREHKALVADSLRIWEHLVIRMSAWHTTHFDK